MTQPDTWDSGYPGEQPEWPIVEIEDPQAPTVQFSDEDFALLLEILTESHFEVNSLVIHSKLPAALHQPAAQRLTALMDLMHKIGQLPHVKEFIVSAKSN